MLNFLEFIFGKVVWRCFSPIIAIILRLKGIKVGKGFYCEGIPKLKLNGSPANICIGDNVQILGSIDLRIRENGAIKLKNDVTVEGNVRIVSAHNGHIQIGRKSIICAFTIINGGADVKIGEMCIIGPRCSINANEHIFSRDTFIRESGFTHSSVNIEDDCWLAANVVINKGVTLSQGTVVGAQAIVTHDTDPYSINVGIPAKKIGERK